MERFSLIISVPVLCSNNVSVGILLCFPGSLVEQLSVGLKSRSNSAFSIGALQSIVELNLLHWHLGMSVWLGSIVWLQIGLSESSAPFFVQSGVSSQLSGCTVSSEETRAGLIKSFLISHETTKLSH